MYSTLDGAKTSAKRLKRLFDDSGIIYPLQKCQAAVAKAGGYQSWFDLERSLAQATRPVDPAFYRRRLIAALPYACQAPVRAQLDREIYPSEDRSDNPHIPPHWYRDVYPFDWAILILHRQRTALIQRGSGRGQELRDSLVSGLLLNVHGGRRPSPWLEPETLALVFRGSDADLFRKDAAHPNFAQEFARLVAAGVFVRRGDALHVLPPAGADVIGEVLEDRIRFAEHWAQSPGHLHELVKALRDALSYLGVADARRIAEAIADQGSDAHITASGPMLTVMSDLADEGRPDAIARAYDLFRRVHPAAASTVRASVPAKIASRYLCGARRLDAGALTRWTDHHPDWAARLTDTLGNAVAFEAQVASMASGIAAVAGVPPHRGAP